MIETSTLLIRAAALLTFLLFSCARAIPLPINFPTFNHTISSVPASAHVDIARTTFFRSQIPSMLSRKMLSRSAFNHQKRNFEEPQHAKDQRPLDRERRSFTNTLQITHAIHESAPTSRRKRPKRVNEQLRDLVSAEPNKGAGPHADEITTNTTTKPAPSQTDNSTISADGHDGEGEQRGEDDESSLMGASGVFGKARSQGGHFVNGGFVEFIEWLFVFILVAPGTFPAIGCVLLTCTNFWRRRLAGPAADSAVAPRTSEDVDVEIITESAPSGYQHVAHADHAALVARPRKGTAEERESQT